MALRVEHELHRRRFSRNLGLGLTLAAFVVLVFALTVVKVSNGARAQGDDHPPGSAPAAQSATSGSTPGTTPDSAPGTTPGAAQNGGTTP